MRRQILDHALLFDPIVQLVIRAKSETVNQLSHSGASELVLGPSATYQTIRPRSRGAVPPHTNEAIRSTSFTADNCNSSFVAAIFLFAAAHAAAHAAARAAANAAAHAAARAASRAAAPAASHAEAHAASRAAAHAAARAAARAASRAASPAAS